VDQGYYCVKLEKSLNHTHYLNMIIGGKEVVMMLDTGIYEDFLLTKTGYGKVGQQFRVYDNAATAQGVGGLSKIQLGTLSDFSFDHKQLVLPGFYSGSYSESTELTLRRTIGKSAVVVDLNYDGCLGNHFLKKYSAVIDYDKDTLHLVPFLSKEIPYLFGTWSQLESKENARPELSISKRADISLKLPDGMIHGELRLMRETYFDAFYIGDLRLDEPVLAGGYYRRKSLDELELLLLKGNQKQIQEAGQELYPLFFDAKDKGKFTHYKFKRVPLAEKK